MKINDAYKALEDLMSKSDTKSGKTYQQLLGALQNLRERDLSADQLRSIEGALDQLVPQKDRELSHKELKHLSNRFLKHVRETLSLVPEGHYMALGLCFGVAFGAVIGSAVHGMAGIPYGTSGTGLGVGIGLIAGFFIGSYLDIEARKQNGVLVTRTR